MTLRERQRQELAATIQGMRVAGSSYEDISSAVGLSPLSCRIIATRQQRAQDDPATKRKALVAEMGKLLQDARVNNPADLRDPMHRMKYASLELRAAAEAVRNKARMSAHLIGPDGKATACALEGLRKGHQRATENRRKMRETIRELLPQWDAQGRSRQALARELRISATCLYSHIKAIKAEGNQR